MDYVEKEYKTVLNTHKFINPWLWDKYSLSAYQGCEFSCIYCYARGSKYNRHFGEEGKIFIKKNAGAMLDLRITRTRTLLPDVVGMSGMCDPYQNGEKKFQETRHCLEALARHKWPVHILTKSPLVTKDLDVLAQIAKDSWAAVSFTITTPHADKARFLEPHAASPEQRFKALAEIKKQSSKIFAGVTAIPIVPLLEDSEEDIRELIKMAQASGADYFIFSPGLTLEGEQALWFLNHLSRRYPACMEKYEALYQFNYSDKAYAGTYGPKKSYLAGMSKKIWEILDQYRMPYRMKRFIPDDFRKVNYTLAEELLDEAYILQDSGKPWSNLFWAGQNIQNLKESILDVMRRGELSSIRNVNGEIEAKINARLSAGNFMVEK